MHRLDLPTNSIPREINVKFSVRTFIIFEVLTLMWSEITPNSRIAPKCTLNGLFTFTYILSKLSSNGIRGGRRERECKVLAQKKNFSYVKGSTPTRLVWNTVSTGLAAVSHTFYWNSDMADVTSSKNAPLTLFFVYFSGCEKEKTRYDHCGQQCTCIDGHLVNCVRIRKEFTTMTLEERARYIRTIKTASTDPRFKTDYANLLITHLSLFNSGLCTPHMPLVTF